MSDLVPFPVDFVWRGYPLKYVTKAAYQAISGPDGRDLSDVLSRARDLAEGPDEPADWHFEVRVGDTVVWIERAGGTRDERGHHGGYWTMYLPEER